MAAITPVHTPSNTLQLAIAPHTVNSGAFNQMAAEGSHLLALPVELQKTILEYVRTSVPSSQPGTHQLISLQLTTNSDKKSACLTCKQMQLLVTPSFYRHIAIAGKRLDSNFKKTIKKEHTGLKHIRTLRITFPLPSSVEEEEKAFSALCRLLVTIPEHSLTSLEYVHSMTQICTSTIDNKGKLMNFIDCHVTNC
jgi:hypothetical protein